MASTTFTDNQTVIYAAWLNDVNNAVYNGVFQSTTLTATNMVCNGTASGAGFTALVSNTFSAPNPIGSVTPNTGAFTTLSATTSLTLNSVPVVTTTGTQTLTNKTLTSPSITGTPVMGASVITSGTAQASTSGTSIDFTGIPSWVKRVTVMLNGVSTNGTSQKLVQIGAGSVTTTGYAGVSNFIASSSSGSASYTNGFNFYNLVLASDTLSGLVTFTTLGSNVWVCSGSVANTTGTISALTNGNITLGTALDRVRITTVNGTDTFDAGSINILFE